MKLCLGVGPFPIHDQHKQVMGDINAWTLVDLYVDHPAIKKWDARYLNEIENNTCEIIYASHLLEHFPHVEVPDILSTWYKKLKAGGRIILNVPDLEWACKQLLKLEKGYLLDGYYNTFGGEHGLLSIFYGSQSHLGEFHQSAYTINSFTELLQRVGFRNIKVRKEEDAHDMGVLIAEGTK